MSMRQGSLAVGLLLGALWMGAPARAMQGGEGMEQMRARFEKFREDHKYTFDLMQLVNGIFELERSSNTKLTPAQAKQVVDILAPLHKQAKLKQQDARETHKKLQAVLTARQWTELNRLQARRQQGQQGARRQGQGGPGGAGPGPGQGQRPPGGGGGFVFDLESRRDFNPYYLPTKAERAKLSDPDKRQVERLEEELKRLKEKASSKP